MLKIEKKARSSDVQVSLRNKEKFFNKSFCRAFSIALGIHLFAILIFTVVSLKIAEGKILSPSMVEAEIASPDTLQENLILAQIEGEKKDPRYQLIPEFSNPELPSLPKLSLLHQIKYMRESSLETNPFVQIEKEIQDSYFSNQIFPSHYVPVEIRFSGTSADRITFEFLPDIANFFSKKETQGELLKQYRALYAVQIENENGEIFWMQAKEESPLKDLNQLAEKILQSLRFKNLTQTFVTKGELEIIFTISNSKEV